MTSMNNIRNAYFLFCASFASCVSHLVKIENKYENRKVNKSTNCTEYSSLPSFYKLPNLKACMAYTTCNPLDSSGSDVFSAGVNPA